VLRLAKGDFGFVDIFGARKKGSEKLVAELTVRGGMVVWDLNGISREDWEKLDKQYTSQGDPRWDGTLGATVRARRR
jgi:dihydroorotase